MSVVMEVKIDHRGRAYLAKVAQPGERYRVECLEPGHIIMRRMIQEKPRRKMSYAQAMEAMAASQLDLGCSYDDLRPLTREP